MDQLTKILISIATEQAELRRDQLALPVRNAERLPGYAVTEHGADSFEHVTLCKHGRDTYGDDAYCIDCDAESYDGESDVPAEWFAGGFADNH